LADPENPSLLARSGIERKRGRTGLDFGAPLVFLSGKFVREFERKFSSFLVVEVLEILDNKQ